MPIVKITSEEISFNKICYEKLGSCEAIEVLYEPHENMMAIRPCQADHPNAVKWVKCNGKRTIMRKLKAYGFSSLLFETNEWKSNFKVKVIGNKNAKGNDSANQGKRNFFLCNQVMFIRPMQMLMNLYGISTLNQVLVLKRGLPSLSNGTKNIITRRKKYENSSSRNRVCGAFNCGIVGAA
jgi:hypothetical protein